MADDKTAASRFVWQPGDVTIIKRGNPDQVDQANQKSEEMPELHKQLLKQELEIEQRSN